MNTSPAFPERTILSRFAISDPQFVSQTPIATLWKVVRPDDTPAALKIYKDGDMRDEAPGFDLLIAQNGLGAAFVYDRTDAEVLMEWLDGPSLGDLVRDGKDDDASTALVDTANRLHQMPADPISSLDPLENRFQSLFRAGFSPNCSTASVATLRAATALATSLIASQTQKRPLHGDFHHENIKGSRRGYLAFDAKGVFGDRHYELANAFWNPFDAKIDVRSRDIIQRRATIWARGFGTTERILLQWAAAYTALSLSWTFKGVFGADVSEHTPYIETLLSMIEEA